MNKTEYIKKYFNFISPLQGMNAMSISDISGIPRATVTRKLNILLKKKYLKINDKKHYNLAKEHKKEFFEIQKINFSHLADFVSQVFNLMQVDQVIFKKDIKLPFYLNPNE